MQAYTVTKRFKCRYTGKLFEPGQEHTPPDAAEEKHLVDAGYLKAKGSAPAKAPESDKSPEPAKDADTASSSTGKKKGKRRKRFGASSGDE